MRLTPEARDAIHAAIEEAHEPGRPTREIAARVVSALREMEPSGLGWVPSYIDELAITGAMKQCADWRRSQQTTAKTAKGSTSPVPAYVGATDDGGQAVQLTFDGMSVDELRAHQARLSTQRDTLSVEIRFLADLIEVMDSDASILTAGQAMAELCRRAA